MRFWHLDIPPDDRLRASYHDSVDFATITCPVNPLHQRAGARLSDLSVELPRRIGNFVWTWYHDLLVDERVLQVFERARVTGFITRPIHVQRPSVALGSHGQLRELVVTGWAGLANPASGIHLDTSASCSACGHLVYSRPTNAARIIDEKAWDGSDFFMVWPLPRYLFVTDRVAGLIRSDGLTGAVLHEARELGHRRWPGGFAPGRLSRWMPRERAHELGHGLGIE